MAYIKACRSFFYWVDKNESGQLIDIKPIHTGAYIEVLTGDFESPSDKQHLSALRMLFDWLVTGHISHANPAHAVHEPSHSQRVGKAPVLMSDQARALMDSIELKNEVAYRDRALIGLMVFSLARISAALSYRVEGYAPRLTLVDIAM